MTVSTSGHWNGRGARLLVIAKEPVAGRVKTRLCPPATPVQAARIAAAAITDTLAAGLATRSFTDRVVVLDGVTTGFSEPGVAPSGPAAPHGYRVVPQHGGALGDRLANAFADSAREPMPALLIGMDTPQVTGRMLGGVLDALGTADAVLGPAADGGWWALALRDPVHARVLRDVPMSRADTGELTLAALRRAGLSVALSASLRDVDTAADAWAAAARCTPGSAFARAVTIHLPAPARAADPAARIPELVEVAA